MTLTTIEFDDITDDRFGGKAAGLAELRRLGLAVPVGFVIANASAKGVLDAATDRFSRMADAGAVPVAVRSSAVGEDGADQSFAGQYDTVLGVNSIFGFAAAVRRCVDSVGSQRASSYSGHSGAVMNVVVQQMVDARAAGVVFTADPATGRRDLMVIDAIAGLGEALVDGTASSDHIVLNSDGTPAVHEVGTERGPLARRRRRDSVRRPARRQTLVQANGSRMGDRPIRETVVAAGTADHHAARRPQRDGLAGRGRQARLHALQHRRDDAGRVLPPDGVGVRICHRLRDADDTGGGASPGELTTRRGYRSATSMATCS